MVYFSLLVGDFYYSAWGEMMFDYVKEEQTFLAELQSGKYSIERIPNNADNYREKEGRDEAVFKEYLQSDSFKTLDSEASKE